MGRLIKNKYFILNLLLSLITANIIIFITIDFSNIQNANPSEVIKILLLMVLMSSTVLFNYLLLIFPNYIINKISAPKDKDVILAKYSFLILLPHLLWMFYKTLTIFNPVSSVCWSTLIFIILLKFYSSEAFKDKDSYLVFLRYSLYAATTFSILYMGQFIVTMLVAFPINMLIKFIT